jgi:hypothetical protein
MEGGGKEEEVNAHPNTEHKSPPLQDGDKFTTDSRTEAI